MKNISLSCLMIFMMGGIIYSQTIISPNYSLKSHETLLIKSIELKADATVFNMSIENRIAGGSFCADKNIYILYPDKRKGRLISASGIPACPAMHKFNGPGEKLDFTLTFPPLVPGTGWVDLIEDCNENCFSFYGISLNNDLNNKLNNVFSLADAGNKAAALDSFIKIAGELDNESSGLMGLVYINIIKLAAETGNKGIAEEWYGKFRLSDAPRLAACLKFLNDNGIKY